MKHVLIVVHSECYNDLRYGCGCSCSIIMRQDISWVFFSRPVANKERNIKSTDATGWYSYLDVYTKLHRGYRYLIHLYRGSNVSVSQRLQHIMEHSVLKSSQTTSQKVTGDYYTV